MVNGRAMALAHFAAAVGMPGSAHAQVVVIIGNGSAQPYYAQPPYPYPAYPYQRAQPCSLQAAKGFVSIANQNLADCRLCRANCRIGGTVFLVGCKRDNRIG
jgi:hypothetical protein